jgi:hypothetical protein
MPIWRRFQESVMNTLFACPHQRTTFPLTPVRNGTLQRDSTYVVCLDCGKEFGYDWRNMRRVAESRRQERGTFKAAKPPARPARLRV